ncbi:uncharacterized protein [Macrobrachium rosenbergii]|uniref:uncharacterized protein isoform X2 n=1 Tax=Macrobrachium rosenbergii TaxID=79674 RepID=UPI0034D4B3F7
MTCHSHPPKPPSSFEGCPCMKSPSLRESMYRSWSELVPRCGGCIAPRMTIRLLGSFVLVSGVMVSSAEGSLFVREEQRYRRCLLQQQGLVGDRHMTQQLEKGKAQDILECYPYNIHFRSVAPDLALGTWLHPSDYTGTNPSGRMLGIAGPGGSGPLRHSHHSSLLQRYGDLCYAQIGAAWGNEPRI